MKHPLNEDILSKWILRCQISGKFVNKRHRLLVSNSEEQILIHTIQTSKSYVLGLVVAASVGTEKWGNMKLDTVKPLLRAALI